MTTLLRTTHWFSSSRYAHRKREAVNEGKRRWWLLSCMCERISTSSTVLCKQYCINTWMYGTRTYLSRYLVRLTYLHTYILTYLRTTVFMGTFFLDLAYRITWLLLVTFYWYIHWARLATRRSSIVRCLSGYRREECVECMTAWPSIIDKLAVTCKKKEGRPLLIIIIGFKL